MTKVMAPQMGFTPTVSPQLESVKHGIKLLGIFFQKRLLIVASTTLGINQAGNND
jgi:hypothetical protein